MMHLIILYIICCFTIIYFISILFYLVGNFKKISTTKNNELNSISIIVAVKNGEKSLPYLLDDLIAQDYKGKFECIIVDDQSTDDTKNIIKKYSVINDKIKYVSSDVGNDNLSFKKKALDAGINKSQHNILLFTDVDCRLPKTWITSMNSHFHDKTDYLIGVAKIDRYKNLISRFQMIDLQILFTVARGMTNLKFPFAAIGQNQAYRKTLYDKVGFLDISNSIQGDDTLFLQLCLKNKIRVDFNDDDNSFVTSRNEENFISFIKQRIRWAADLKVFWNYNKPLFIVSLSTYVTNLMIVLSTFGFIFFNKMVFPFLYPMILAKLILEYILYNIGAKNLSFKMNNMTFIYWFFLNVPYVVLMGAGSFFVKYIGWRGQKIHK